MAAIQEEAEKLAEARRLAREETRELLQRVQLESDDERERKAKKAANKKVKSEVVSGDEAPNGEGPPRKKKRVVRKGKKEKGATSGKEGSDAEDGALFSGGEELEKPVKKVRTHSVSLTLFRMTEILTSRHGFSAYEKARRQR